MVESYSITFELEGKWVLDLNTALCYLTGVKTFEGQIYTFFLKIPTMSNIPPDGNKCVLDSGLYEFLRPDSPTFDLWTIQTLITKFCKKCLVVIYTDSPFYNRC